MKIPVTVVKFNGDCMKPKTSLFRALSWIDTTPHYIGEWYPKNAEPKESTHIQLKGDHGKITIDRTTWSVMSNSGMISYDHGDDDFLFKLSENGKMALHEMKQGTI